MESRGACCWMCLKPLHSITRIDWRMACIRNIVGGKCRLKQSQSHHTDGYPVIFILDVRFLQSTDNSWIMNAVERDEKHIDGASSRSNESSQANEIKWIQNETNSPWYWPEIVLNFLFEKRAMWATWSLFVKLDRRPFPSSAIRLLPMADGHTRIISTLGAHPAKCATLNACVLLVFFYCGAFGFGFENCEANDTKLKTNILKPDLPFNYSTCSSRCFH